ncbi:hypothetical protein [Acinetobacter pollinis]|uniref:WYL domain-containing protein n=1 Tax=Acinetobacter pollinis TaxID=2605270 RepID=A0ABU6DTY3_9GAMM|nr:hypothetical protein [Acinetobacter pollinis]MEB5477290.1 hypothetical protein [Acinetobacter pollinis]
MEQEFKQAIKALKKVKITFYSKEDGHNLKRLCAPMDYGPSRRAHNKDDRFHLWDYESDKKNHTLSLLPIQVKEIEVLEESFDPSEFITWNVNTSPWHYPRDWGQYS